MNISQAVAETKAAQNAMASGRATDAQLAAGGKPIELKSVDGSTSNVAKVDLANPFLAKLSDFFLGAVNGQNANSSRSSADIPQAAARAERQMREAPSGPQTLERAQSAYEKASDTYEQRASVLNKLLAETGDYAGYGADLERAKTSAADAKAKMEEAADAYRAMGGTIDRDANERVGKTIAGGAEQYLASLLGTAGSYYEGGTRGSKAQIERDLADMAGQEERAQKAYDEALAKYNGDTENVNVQAAARALKEVQDNRQLYQGMLENTSLEETAGRIYGASDRMGERGAQNIAEAKEGLGAGGQFLVDTGAAGVQLLGDIALGTATGLGMMPVMGARSYGGGANEARQAGGTYEQQVATGAATAAVEMLTEKLADGLAGVAGKGAADDAAKEIIRKWAKTDAGRTALRALYGISGEASEEAISTLVSPLVKRIYDSDALREGYGTADGRKELINEALHDALVGGALGGFGTLGSIGNGQNAAELADMRMRDASMGDVGSQVNNAFDVLSGRMTPEQSQAREAAAMQALGMNQQAPAPVSATVEQPAPAPVTGQDALLEAAGIQQPAVEQAPAPAPVVEQAAEAQAPVEEAAPAAQTPEERQAQIQQRLDEINAELDNQDIDEARIDELYAEGNALLKESQALEQQIEARNTQQARVDAGEVSKQYGEAENHIDNRTNASVAAQGVKAFQFDHPELHNHFVQAAYALADLVQSAQGIDATTRNRSTTSKYYTNKKNRYADAVRSLVEMGMSKPRILQCCQDIINNNGAENYADAKRVELALNDMLTNGYISLGGEIVEPNADYIAAKDAITGAKAKPAAGSWEAYLAKNELNLALGEVTEEQLRAEWEAQQPAQPAEAPEQPVTPEAPAPAPSPAAEQQQTGEQQTGEQQAGGPTTAPFTAPEGLNTKSTEREGRMSSNTIAKAEEAAGVPEEQRTRYRYATKSEGQSIEEAAARLKKDRSGEVQKLLEAEAWSGAQTDMAAQIAKEFYEAGDTEAYAAWRSVMEKAGREGGRGVQAWAKYTRGTGESAFGEVTDAVNANERLTPEQKENILKNAKEASDAYDAAMKDVNAAKAEAETNGKKAEAPESLINLIKETSAKRGTGTIFKKNLDKLLNAQKGNVDYLSALAYNQILAMSNDYTQQRTLAEYAKTFQTLSQLSSVATFGRNVLGNFTFGAVDTLAKDSFALALDRMVSKATGKRTVALDKGWFSSKARKGAYDGLTKSALEVALDVDMNGGETVNRYDQQGGRTNKMTGGPVERFFSRWEQLLNYSLTTSDKFSRGAIEAEYARGIDALENSNLTEEEKAALAEQEADYRLFQNKDTAYKFSKGVHDVFNLAGFGGKVEGVGRKGGFGLGDIVNTYPGVPANLGVKPLEYSPANIAKGGVELFQVMKDAKNGKVDPSKQYKAVTDIARGLTGTPIIALFASMFKAGLLKNWDDEDDKDAKALNAAEGKSGTQINLDAAMRWLNGESAEWKNGDTLDSVGYLEPMNAFMSIGGLMAGLDEDAAKTDLAKAYATGAIQSFLDIPVMSNLANMIDTYNYSSAEDLPGKAAEAALSYGGGAAAGFIPQPLRGTAKALDEYYRDTHGSNVFESIGNSFKATIPGEKGRESLPTKLDNFGEPKKYSGGTAQRLFDTLINPGSRTTLDESEESKFLFDLRESSGDDSVIPDRNAPKKLDIDGEKVELTQDEQRLYQQTYGQLAKQYTSEMMDDDLFATLSPEEQASVIKELFSQAKQQASDAIKDGRASEGARSKYAQLIEGEVNPGGGKENDIPPLDEKNVTEYFLFDTVYGKRLKENDYAGLDEMISNYGKLDENTRAVIAAKNQDNINNLLELADAGVGSESFFTYKDAQKEAQIELDKAANTGGDVKMLALANADIPEEDKAAMMYSDALDISKNRLAAYDVLSNYGFTVEDVYGWFDNADWAYNKNADEYKSDQKLSPLEVAAAIRASDIPAGKKSEAYQAFYDWLHGNGDPKYDQWVGKNGKPYTYESEIKYLDRTGYLYGKAAVKAFEEAAGLG